MPRRVPRETTRRGLELVDIASPYTGTDRVLRRVDSLKQLHGSGVIGDREMRAAEHFRTACETIESHGIHCALESVPGPAEPASRTPPLHALQAADTLQQAHTQLGRTDYAVVLIVVNVGMKIGEAARYFGFAREHVGHRLRYALRQLADLWFGAESSPRKHMHREADARPKASAIDNVAPGKVAHASRKGVSY